VDLLRQDPDHYVVVQRSERIPDTLRASMR
jgi:hypothetical protein